VAQWVLKRLLGRDSAAMIDGFRGETGARGMTGARTQEEVVMERIRIEQHSSIGTLWFAGWLFTIGFLRLLFWKGVLAILLWPYYLGGDLAGWLQRP
jgi:hypothetical protein